MDSLLRKKKGFLTFFQRHGHQIPQIERERGVWYLPWAQSTLRARHPHVKQFSIYACMDKIVFSKIS